MAGRVGSTPRGKHAKPPPTVASVNNSCRENKKLNHSNTEVAAKTKNCHPQITQISPIRPRIFKCSLLLICGHLRHQRITTLLYFPGERLPLPGCGLPRRRGSMRSLPAAKGQAYAGGVREKPGVHHLFICRRCLQQSLFHKPINDRRYFFRGRGV